MDDAIKVEGQKFVAATSTRLDNRTRTLKYGDSFAVFDRFGDIQLTGLGEQGIFSNDTRYLSRFELLLENDLRPVLLNSSVNESNTLFTVDLTTPDIFHEGKKIVQQDTVHIRRSKLLHQLTSHEVIDFFNYADQSIQLNLAILLDADFADIFEVRGAVRAHKGTVQPSSVTSNAIEKKYTGLDKIERQTKIEFDINNAIVKENSIHFSIQLEPHQNKQVEFWITYGITSSSAHQAKPFYEAFSSLTHELEKTRRHDVKIDTSNEQFNAWINRSVADLYLLVSRTEHGSYPYAGVPWFSTPFGRDGILTAIQYLWVNPELSKGVLNYLAKNQATILDHKNDSEPGKILHETRKGEMSATGEIPFEKYYGTIDATPLFIVLAGAYYDQTGDKPFIKSIWSNIELALDWIEKYGDKDDDGYVEYSCMSPNGLVQQAWKDSDDSIFHADGTPALGNIAICEVQGYVYDAWIKTADLLNMLGDSERAMKYLLKANQLKENFNRDFWCEELGTFALALDGDKNPCRVKSSNAGHTLFSGIASQAHAEQIADSLLSDHSFCGWGIRTIANDEIRYNPMSYHNGAVWPHDNAIIALGLGRYGFHQNALKLIAGLFDASVNLELHRMPELFCGFTRKPGEGPTLYPVACSPQAWSSVVIFSMLKVCLGLSISATPKPKISFNKPFLPPFLDSVELKDIRVGKAKTDILIRHHRDDVGIIVLNKSGEIDITVQK